MFDPYPQEEHQSFSAGSSTKRALFVHGFPGTPAELRSLAQALADRGWQVSVPLLPGFGKDIINLGGKRHHDWLRAVESEFARLKEGASQTLLIGFSMGGALCLTASLTLQPDQLVLIAPFSKLPDWRANFLPLLQYVLPELRPYEKANFSDPGIRAELTKLLPSTNLDDPDIQAQLRKLITLKTATLNELRRVGNLAYANAPKVASPCVIIQGLDDTTVIAPYTQRLVKRFKTAPRYIEIPGNHDFIKVSDARYAKLLGTFLEQVIEPSS
jgi:carboxylesterase